MNKKLWGIQKATWISIALRWIIFLCKALSLQKCCLLYKYNVQYMRQRESKEIFRRNPFSLFLSQNWGFLRKSAWTCANAYANTYAFAYAYALVTRLRSKLNKFPSKTSKNGRPNAWLLQNEDCNYLTLKAALIWIKATLSSLKVVAIFFAVDPVVVNWLLSETSP